MMWSIPSAEELRRTLVRGGMTEPEAERAVALFVARERRPVRWSEMDREFARRALARRRGHR